MIHAYFGTCQIITTTIWMKYFKNTELATLYHVSEKSVRNWIASAQASKTPLALHEEKGRWYIANTSHNLEVIEELVERGKKFKNSRGRKVICPKPELYEHFTGDQIIDILSNIDIYGEIPLQYTYFNGGAEEWRAYAERLMNEKTPNMLTSHIELLHRNDDYIKALAGPKKLINVIDLGPGDGSPVKGLLSSLLELGALNRYVAIDFSKDMLAIAEENIRSWFKDVPFESRICDLNYDRFEDVVRADMFSADSGKAVNFVLLLGGTLTNLPNPDYTLQIIRASMGRDDCLLYGLKLDTDASRRFFDFANTSASLSKRHAMILNMLNIDPSMYEVEQFYDQDKKSRIIRVRFKLDITLELEANGMTRHFDLRKDQRVLIWRYWHQTAMDVLRQFDRNGFDLLQASLTEDKEYMLLAGKIRIT